MIKLHKLNGSEFVINTELIELVEAIPDTRVTLITGNQFIVKEDVDFVIEKIKEYRSQVYGEELKRQQKITRKLE
jgi:flagellar protein FlbD